MEGRQKITNKEVPSTGRENYFTNVNEMFQARSYPRFEFQKSTDLLLV